VIPCKQVRTENRAVVAATAVNAKGGRNEDYARESGSIGDGDGNQQDGGDAERGQWDGLAKANEGKGGYESWNEIQVKRGSHWVSTLHLLLSTARTRSATTRLSHSQVMHTATLAVKPPPNDATMGSYYLPFATRHEHLKPTPSEYAATSTTNARLRSLRIRNHLHPSQSTHTQYLHSS
jgi:hypothetical protein